MVGEDPSAEQLFKESLIKLISAHREYEYGAVKIITLPDGDGNLKRTSERMQKELQAMQTFGTHASCLKLMEQGPEAHSFVTEYHPRGALSQEDNRDRYKGDFSSALRDFRRIVELLSRVHARKFVHRDVAPKNIFIGADNHLVLGDWGIVWFSDVERTRLSLVGEVLGTKDMMPVWVRGKRIEDIPPNCDVYCCGKTLWMMVRGGKGEPVPRERWDRDHFNLEKLFPDAPGIGYARELFSKTMVEEVKDCLPSAKELLAIVDELLIKMRRTMEPFSKDRKRHCLLCGKGGYIFLTSGSTDLRSQDRDRKIQTEMGLDPTHTSSYCRHVARCDNCGHVQYFVWKEGETPDFWK